MTSPTRRPALLAGVAAALLVTTLSVPSAGARPTAAHPTAHPTAGRPGVTATLPLGAADLPETRVTHPVQPGVTLTAITRGGADPDAVWTVEVAIPAGSSSPDPDAPATALSDARGARATAERLRAAGLHPRLEPVRTPATADTGGLLGYRVRVGSAATKAGADAVLASVRAAGLTGSSVYTGWDADAGARPARGPWHLQVLTIDPRIFRGSLRGSYGPDFVNRETTSSLARAAGATAGVNAGFFVLDPAAGAPGDPAGVGVYRGRLESETTNGRPALVVHDDGRRTTVPRLWWRGSVSGSHGRSLGLDGLNRVPGLIRNCGGTADDQPTPKPLQDTTCTDPDEIVAFDSAYGATTPAGPGAEIILDRAGHVLGLRNVWGSAVPAGGRVVQATGRDVDRLVALGRGSARLRVTASLRDAHGQVVRTTRDTTIVNGGPVLVRDGRIMATPGRDGMVHPGDPSFYYGWAHKRNPRTFAGVDGAGRTVLVTADGRSTASLGLSISEAAAVARALGLRQAMNLDGGGSTTMVEAGRVVNAPSDATGERPIGDALLVLPRR